MKAVYVEPKKTPLTWEEAYKCMSWALKNALGRDPEDEVVALAMAKTALETGRWTSIWNSNWGNVKASESYEGMYTCIVLNEVLLRDRDGDGDKELTVVWFAPEGELTGNPAKGGVLKGPPMPVPPGHIQTRMRAYANPYDGVDQYVDFVATGRYQKAWRALLTGNAVQYIHELKLAKYFTADEGEYVKAVASLQREMLGRIRKMPDVPKADVEWERLLKSLPALQFQLEDLLRETPPEATV